MNVLLYSSEFPTPANRSSSVFTYYMAKELNKLCSLQVVSALPWFPNVDYLKVNKKWAEKAEIPFSFDFNGLTVSYPRYPLLPKISSNFHPFLQAVGSFNHVKKLHKKNNFDVINAHWIYPDGVAAVILGKWLRIPVVLTAMGCDINVFGQNPVKRMQIVWALKNAQKATAKSLDLVRKMQGMLSQPHNIEQIPNGVHAEKFIFTTEKKKALRQQFNLSNDKQYLLYIGRLSEEKGLDILIAAMNELKKNNLLSFQVLIAGSGNLDSYLKSCVSNYNLENSISFLGQLSREEVALWMAVSDGVCLPSRREGLPNVILEALASGLPVVASRVGGVPELLNKENGIMVEPENPQALAEGIVKLFTTEWNRTRIYSSVKHRTWKSVAQQYYQCFKSAVL